MQKELISIIIPVYNVETYLEQCLESVISQSYSDIEIVLVNDGSKDNSLTICRNYQKSDSRVFVIDKINEGLSKTRNAGIQYSHGSYFVTIDSDDYLEKDYIEKMYRMIKKTDADICLCARESFENEKIKEYYLDKRLPECVDIRRADVERHYAEYTRLYQMSDSWNKMYRRKFVTESGIIFYLPKKYNGTDLLFNHLLLLHMPRIAVVNEILYHYRILPNSRVRRKDKPLQEGFIIIVKELLREAQHCGYRMEVFQQIYLIYAYMMKYVTFDIVIESEAKEDIKQKFQKVLEKHKEFFTKADYSSGLYKFLPIRMKVFWFCLANGNGNGLYWYYKFREILQ